MTTAAEVNAKVWQALYAAGRNDLRYPSENVVRFAGRFFGAGKLRILDFGFGTGANLIHLAGLGHRMHGVEISADALARAKARVESIGVSADLRLVVPGAPLPFEAASFDAVIAWQVIYYNDREGWARTVRELERVTVPEGRIVIATAAPGDVSQVNATPLGRDVYRSEVEGQAGCILTIPDRKGLAGLFPGRELEVGEFGHDFHGARARHWIISYRTPPS